MFKKLLCLISFCSIFYFPNAQTDSLYQIDSFTMNVPEHKIENSKYSSIFFLDNRKNDSGDLGYIIKDAVFKSPVFYKVKPAYDLQDQFTDIFDSLYISNSDTGKLALQVSKLKFATTALDKDFGRYFLFRAILYEVTNEGYRKIDETDTLVNVSISTNNKFIVKCNKVASKIITNFISRNLMAPHIINKEYLGLNDVVNIDSLDKTQIDLYNRDTLVDGVYSSYISLKSQMPEYTDFTAKIKNGKLKKVEKNSHSADDDMDYTFNDVYAVVTQNKVFIHRGQEYYQMEKRENDFFFIEKTNSQTNGFPLVFVTGGGLPLFAGVLGLSILGNVASKTDSYTLQYEFKLDHVDGSFIPVREIKNKPQ